MENTRDHCCALDTPRNRDRALEKSGSLPAGWLRCPRWGSLPLSGVPLVTALVLFCSALCRAADPADGGCGHAVWPEGARRQAGARPQHHPGPLRRAPPGRGGNLSSISTQGWLEVALGFDHCWWRAHRRHGGCSSSFSFFFFFSFSPFLSFYVLIVSMCRTVLAWEGVALGDHPVLLLPGDRMGLRAEHRLSALSRA